MMKTDQIGVGIIGCGRITDMHVPGYRDFPRARLVAVCDADPDLAERRAAQWGCRRFYTDYRKLLEDREIDMVEVCTPHHLHHPMVLDAVSAGKHVSVQKPMALTTEQCDEMISAARGAGVKFRVFENFVFYPPYVKTKELIEAGEIGEPLSIRFKLGSCIGGWHVPLKSWFWRFNQAACGGGPSIFDDGYHKFSVAVDFLGPVEKVYAWVDYSFAVIDSPSLVAWTYKDGKKKGFFELTLSPNITVKSKYYSADERVEITGTDGVIWLARCSGRLLEEPVLILYRDGETRAFHDLRDDWQDSFTDSTRHFINAIIDGNEPKLTGERGKEVTQFCIAAYRSFRLKKEVRPGDVKGGVEGET